MEKTKTKAEKAIQKVEAAFGDLEEGKQAPPAIRGQEEKKSPAGSLSLVQKILVPISIFLGVLTLVSAVGLLKRKELARRLFVVCMATTIVLALGSFVFTGIALWEIWKSQQSSRLFAFALMIIPGALVTTVICLVYGWIIKKLISNQIKQEFAATA